MSSDLGACFLCQSADGGPLSHICTVCNVEVCPSCIACKQLSACPACGDTEQSWQTLQKLGSVVLAYSSARDWFRGGAITKPSAASPKKSQDIIKPIKTKSASGELRPAVVEEVLDWLKDEVDESWLDEPQGFVEKGAEPQVFETLELVDAGKKCTSIIGANGDYRSGMAREAVAYLLQSTMKANKAKMSAGKNLPQSNSNNSTAAPSTEGSACPTQRSEKPEASACPTQRSEKPEECFRMIPPAHSQMQSPRPVEAPTECDVVVMPARDEQNDAAADNASSAEASMAQNTWGFAPPSLAALTKGFESLKLPAVPSWSATATNHCSNLQIAHREVMEHAPPAPANLQKPVMDESPHADEWATDHFASLENFLIKKENIAQSLLPTTGTTAATASADDECRSYVTSIICPPVVPPLVFPSSANQDRCAPCVTEAMQTASTKSDSNPSTDRSEVTKGACDKATCVGISGDEDVCPKGHDLRWHSWCCSSCNKRGGGLRFSCVECFDANLCVACKKTNEAQKQVAPMSSASEVCADSAQPEKAMGVITEDQVASAIEATPKSSNRDQVAPAASIEVPASKINVPARSSSSRRERPAGSASKSVLSVNTMGTSSAAQLLGGLTQQQGSKPRSSSSKKAFESKSCVGAPSSGSMQRQRPTGQRAGGSVLSVKNTSSSAAASLLGPLMEQKAKR